MNVARLGIRASNPNRLSMLYKLGIAAIGWSVLLVSVSTSSVPLPWLGMVFFALLSIGLKRLGFEVVQGVRHSLVGVVDLAALFVYGALPGTIVASVSGSVCRLLCVRDEGPKNWASVGVDALFTGGLNTLMMLTAAAIYRHFGGQVPVARVTWSVMPPVLAASIGWFALDHLGWAVAELLVYGWQGLLAFLQRILPYSLLIELAPLPFSVLISSAYLSLDQPLLMLVLLAVLGVGLALHRLLVSLSEERRHVRELSSLGTMGRALLEAGLDLDQTCALIYAHCRDLIKSPTFALQLHDERNDHVRTALLVVDGQPVPLDGTDLGDRVFRWMEAERRPLCIREFTDKAPFAPLPMGQRAASGLYAPIITEGTLLGVIALQSPVVGAYTSEDQDALSRVASQGALGLQATKLYRQEQERAAQLMAIAQVSRKVAAILELRTLFADTVHLVKEAFGYYCVSIFTVDADREHVTFQASSSDLIQQRGVQVTWGEGLVGLAASSGNTVLANDVLVHPHFVLDNALKQTRAELCVPLKVEQRILGVLDVQCDRAAILGDQDVFVLQTLADQIAVAIEDSRIYEGQQAQAWVSTALLQVAEAVAQLTTAEEMLATIARLTLMLAGVDRCLIFLWSEEDLAFTAVEAAGPSKEQISSVKQQRFAAGVVPLLDKVRKSGEVAHGSSEDLGAHMPPPWQSQAGGEVTAFPLRIKGEVIGVLVVEHTDDPTHMTQHRESILVGIAHHAAMGLDNARLYHSQREEAWVTTALLQVATMISVSRDLDEIISTVVRLTPLLTGVEWSVILVWDEARCGFFVSRVHGMPKAQRDRIEGQYLYAEEVPLLGEPIMRGQPLIVQAGQDERLLGTLDAYVQRGAVTALPLQAHERLLGAFLVGHDSSPRPASDRRTSILAGIAHQTSLAVETALLYQQAAEQERLQRAIDLARDIQESFLPECCPVIPGYQLAVEWRAARGVGGDYYDFINLDSDHLGLVIADVSDKGVGAALYMVLSRAVMRAATIGASGPAETLLRANRILMEDSRSGMFVSVFYGVLELSTGRLTYARAGHNPPFYVRGSNNSLTPLEAPGAVLGILDDLPVEERTVQLEGGDLVVMYTDGVTEAINEQDEEFGEERLAQVLVREAASDAGVLVEQINAAVRLYTGECPQFDDFTLVVLKRES